MLGFEVKQVCNDNRAGNSTEYLLRTHAIELLPLEGIHTPGRLCQAQCVSPPERSYARINVFMP